MDHPLSQARQRAVVAIATQKQRFVQIGDLAATYAAGAVVLRMVEEEAKPEPTPEPA